MESKIKRKNKSWLILIGSLIFLSGIGLITYDYLSNRKIDEKETELLEEFYEIEDDIESIEEPQVIEEVKEQVKVNYIAVLKIPKIGLERGLVDPNSYLNNVNYNLEWLDGSSMPDEVNGNVIIAGHSGSARISYFRKLDRLEIGDEASIIYNGKTYNYKVVDIYDIEKTGTAEIVKERNTTTLTLITCRHNTNRQIVVILKQL
ncbi:MAG: sortase [Bacilli bacterium]|nr:sortase [Bacilli bacterium]MBQ6497355.1 sortase [Bacilli bacterium]